jgi:hypothetical protein
MIYIMCNLMMIIAVIIIAMIIFDLVSESFKQIED